VERVAPSHRAAVDLLVEIGKEGCVRAHRPAVLRACIKALQLCDGTDGLTFHDAAIGMREQNRLIGRSLPSRAVGSTLLLKGLEAEAAVILDADRLDARNLYVAMTRGSKALTVCSPTPVPDQRVDHRAISRYGDPCPSCVLGVVRSGLPDARWGGSRAA
jgi:hypothetical protein